jgi:hypothetical protein
MDRREAKFQKDADKKRARRELFRYVSQRDGYRSRVSGRRTRVTLALVPERAEHHHVIHRSLGGKDTKENVILITLQEHIDHHHHRLTISGSGEGEIVSQYDGQPPVSTWPEGRRPA